MRAFASVLVALVLASLPALAAGPTPAPAAAPAAPAKPADAPPADVQMQAVLAGQCSKAPSVVCAWAWFHPKTGAFLAPASDVKPITQADAKPAKAGKKAAK